jgi:hypothetical protein
MSAEMIESDTPAPGVPRPKPDNSDEAITRLLRLYTDKHGTAHESEIRLLLVMAHGFGVMDGGISFMRSAR